MRSEGVSPASRAEIAVAQTRSVDWTVLRASEQAAATSLSRRNPMNPIARA